MEGNEQFWVYLALPTDTGRQILSRCGSVRIIDNEGKKDEEGILHEHLNDYFVRLDQLEAYETWPADSMLSVFVSVHL